MEFPTACLKSFLPLGNKVLTTLQWSCFPRVICKKGQTFQKLIRVQSPLYIDVLLNLIQSRN